MIFWWLLCGYAIIVFSLLGYACSLLGYACYHASDDDKALKDLEQLVRVNLPRRKKALNAYKKRKRLSK